MFCRISVIVCGLVLFLCGRVMSEAFIVVDNTSGHVLNTDQASKKMPVASLAKMATVLVAIDMADAKRLNLGQVVRVTKEAVQASGGARPSGLQVGDELSIRDLIYCAMLASDDIASNVIAYHVGRKLPSTQGLPPIPTFVSHMNALARILKMRKTVFLNATGMESRAGTVSYSTAADMARLTRYAYTRPGFRFFANQKSRVVHVQRAGADYPISITNNNQLLGVDRIDGVKAARSARAGGCVILSAERVPQVVRDGGTTYVTPRRISVVVLGSKNRFDRGRALLRQGWQLYDQWANEGREMKPFSTL